ncbi:MAG: hypothetical protein AAF621_04500, partial [Pseudomonadota bacterium]
STPTDSQVNSQPFRNVTDTISRFAGNAASLVSRGRNKVSPADASQTAPVKPAVEGTATSAASGDASVPTEPISPRGVEETGDLYDNLKALWNKGGNLLKNIKKTTSDAINYFNVDEDLEQAKALVKDKPEYKKSLENIEKLKRDGTTEEQLKPLMNLAIMKALKEPPETVSISKEQIGKWKAADEYIKTALDGLTDIPDPIKSAVTKSISGHNLIEIDAGRDITGDEVKNLTTNYANLLQNNKFNKLNIEDQEAIKNAFLSDGAKKKLAKDIKEPEAIDKIITDLMEEKRKATELLERQIKTMDDIVDVSAVKDKSHIPLEVGKLKKAINALDPQAKAAYNKMLSALDGDLKDVNEKTAHLHYTMLASAMSGKEIEPDDLAKLKKNAESGKTSFEDFDKFRVKYFEEPLTDKAEFYHPGLKKKLQEVRERQDLENELIGSNGFSREEWDKLSEDGKEQVLKDWKAVKAFKDKLPEEQREKLEKLSPLEQIQALKKITGKDDLSSDDAKKEFDNLLNNKDYKPLDELNDKEKYPNFKDNDEAKRKFLKDYTDAYNKNQEAQREAAEKMAEEQRKAQDAQLRNFQDGVQNATQSVSRAAQGVMGLAQILSQLRETIGQQLKQQLERQQAAAAESQKSASKKGHQY